MNDILQYQCNGTHDGKRQAGCTVVHLPVGCVWCGPGLSALEPRRQNYQLGINYIIKTSLCI